MKPASFKTPGRVSKHRQFDADTHERIEGNVRILGNSSLRKLMRAARRGRIPDERQVLIDAAMDRAGQRRAAYLNSSLAKRGYRTAQRAAAAAARAKRHGRPA